MRTETTHTPTPWRYGQVIGLEADPNYWEISAGKGFHPGDGFSISGCISESDAAFIIRAVNAHEGLLSLLKEARNRMIGNSPAIVDLAKRTDAAIAKAEGK